MYEWLEKEQDGVLKEEWDRSFSVSERCLYRKVCVHTHIGSHFLLLILFPWYVCPDFV